MPLDSGLQNIPTHKDPGSVAISAPQNQRQLGSGWEMIVFIGPQESGFRQADLYSNEYKIIGQLIQRPCKKEEDVRGKEKELDTKSLIDNNGMRGELVQNYVHRGVQNINLS